MRRAFHGFCAALGWDPEDPDVLLKAGAVCGEHADSDLVAIDGLSNPATRTPGTALAGAGVLSVPGCAASDCE